MKRAIIEYVENDGGNISDKPVMMIFQGKTFTGEKSEKYILELKTILADDVPYFIIEENKSNVVDVAKKIVELIG